MNPFASVLITISTLTQGPLPVAQAKARAVTMRDSARIAVLTGMAGCAMVVLTIASVPRLRHEFAMPESLSIWLVLLLLGDALLYALANLLIVMATFTLGPPLFGLLFTLRVIPLAAISMAVLGEPFTWFTVIGDTMVVVGVLMTATIKGRSALKKASRPPLAAWLYGGGATLAFGSANAVDAAVVEHITAITFAPLRLLMPALITAMALLALGRKQRRKSGKMEGSAWLHWKLEWELWVRLRGRPLLLIVAFMPVSATSFMWAVQLTNKAGVLAAIHQTSLFLTIIISSLAGDKWKWRELPLRLRRDVPRELRRYWLPAVICYAGVAVALGIPSLLKDEE